MQSFYPELTHTCFSHHSNFASWQVLQSPKLTAGQRNHILTNCSRKTFFQNTVQHIWPLFTQNRSCFVLREKTQQENRSGVCSHGSCRVTQEHMHTAVGGGCTQAPCQQQTAAVHLCPEWSQGDTSRHKWKCSWQGALLVGSGKMCRSQAKPRTCVHCRNVCHIFPAQWRAIQKLSGQEWGVIFFGTI